MEEDKAKEPQYRSVNEFHRMFLEFFESKGHLAMKSFSLVPHNDNSLFSISSGVAPLKSYFTGQEIPPRNRVTTCQKCIRTGDIEDIGKTARHGTLFEMLGNFFFGDYFKHEAIRWTWEFLTDVVGLDPDRLYPSVYLDDNEAFEIWNKEIGIPAKCIFKFGKEDNFREHGSGPCGPCSEIYYDRSEAYGCGKPGCTVGCNCGRYVEVRNNASTQFDDDGHGNYTELEYKNIDTGMGLERLAVVVQGVDSLFTVDTNKALLDRVRKLVHTQYQKDHETDVSLRIVVDHVRSCTFMISDGIMPSNEGRGCVLRRLLRRAARHGGKLGIEGEFLADLFGTVIELCKDRYPELEEKQAMIFKVLSGEGDKFNKTIDQRLTILGEMEEEMQSGGGTTLPGANAFKLYDTCGFPLDLTKEILEEKGYGADEGGFTASMKEQKDKARKARKTTNYMGADVTVYQSINPVITTEFIGCDRLTADSRIPVLTTEDELVQALTDRQKGTIIMGQTPFYGIMGGQRGDVGATTSPDGAFKVEDTIHLQGGKVGHVGVTTKGMFQMDDAVTLSVCRKNRTLICKNHSAAHLLQKALRIALGGHVEQAGSYVDAGGLRFDFTHFSATTVEEIKKVEDLVNEEIQAAPPVMAEIITLKEAKKTGAMALFGEKYDDNVRVVGMGDFSTELCGGTHVANTSNIASFKILSETGIAAGVGRIGAPISEGLIKHYEEVGAELHEVARTAETTPASLTTKIEVLPDEIKSLRIENEKLKNKLAKDSLGDVISQVREVNGVKVLASGMAGVDMSGLRGLGNQLKDKLGEGVVVIASEQDGKVNLMATATGGAQKQGVHVGNLIKAIAGLVGGGGDDRPNMAQAGGKNPVGIENTLKRAVEVVQEQAKQP